VSPRTPALGLLSLALVCSNVILGDRPRTAAARGVGVGRHGAAAWQTIAVQVGFVAMLRLRGLERS
jgi:hypothetical protein